MGQSPSSTGLSQQPEPLDHESKLNDVRYSPEGSSMQRSLRSCGFASTAELQLEAGQHAALETVHPAWTVVLQHMYVTPQLACRLLSVSRGIRSTVKLVWSGQLRVNSWNTNLAEHKDRQQILTSLARWLPRHAALLGHLDVAFLLQRIKKDMQPSMEAVIARAMWEAGSSLQLKPCHVHSGLLVQQMAFASMRTRLTDLTFYPEGGMLDDMAQPTIQALRQLTALRSLTCSGNGALSINSLLPAMSDLTNLASLSAGFNRRADVGKFLPVSLMDLKLGSAPHPNDPKSLDEGEGDEESGRYLPPISAVTGEPFVYHLAHLTAVTALDFWMDVEEEDWEALYMGDELPPNTEFMYAAVAHGASLAVLQPLTRLDLLDLRHSNMEASQLQSLTALHKLESLTLREYDLRTLKTPADYCEAWPPLPMEEMSVTGVVTPLVLENSAKLTSVTYLQLWLAEESSVDLEQLATVLKKLKNLDELIVDWIDVDDEELPPWELQETGLGCAEALPGMRELYCLNLRGIYFPRAAAPHFAELQQLTELRLARCCIDDYMVNVIALHLTGLCRLNLSGNEDVTDVCLPTVGKLMLKLGFLALCHTRVTTKGLVWLRQLPLLVTMGLCRFDNSDASVSGWKALQTWCDELDCPRRLK